MLEQKADRVLPWRQFAWRLAGFIGVAALITCVALGIGVMGYHWIAKLKPIDALLNASMILAGMGPADNVEGTAAKVFASAYALFSGLVFITVAGVVFTPVIHRILHHFHVEDDA